MGVRGVAYVAFGSKAVREATMSAKSLRAHHSLPVVALADGPVRGATIIPFDEPGNGARRAKLSITKVVPHEWTHIMYLDADTRVKGNLEAGFFPVENGWDMAITISTKQIRNGLLWHVGDREQEATYQQIGNPWPVALQGGVWWVNRETTRDFFDAWLAEWEKFKGPDQGALLRALHVCPIKVYLMGRPFNDGDLLEHHYGAAA